MELPESSKWHPLKAASHYRLRAEEAAGRYLTAFEEYARLKREYREREEAADARLKRDHRRTSHALDYTWGQTGEAKACVSDLNTYSTMAQTFAAMATTKTLQYLSDRELGRDNSE